MLNAELTQRFGDWLLNPREALDFEVKGWLDLSNEEHRALIAKGLIALENYGGGHLLIGYKDDNEMRLIPDSNRPESLESYNVDEVNAIIKRYAEPQFHVEVTKQIHPENGQEFPLLTVHGRTTVPVRTASASPSRKVSQNSYYIRRPGPESSTPQTGAEWDQLIRRCVERQRQDIVALLRGFVDPVSMTIAPTARETLKSMTEDALKRWESLNDELTSDDGFKLTHGYYYFSASILGQTNGLSAGEVRDLNASAKSYTGWPVLQEGYGAKTKTRPVDGYIETWFAPGNWDPSVVDFWRIHPTGCFRRPKIDPL